MTTRSEQLYRRGPRRLPRRGHSPGRAPGPMTPRPEQLYRRALQRLTGGVNSPVRAMPSIGREHPIFIESGSGSRIRDVDGAEYVDYVCSWGPLILGHARPGVLAAVKRAADQ